MLSEAARLFLFLLFQSYHEFANYLCREVFTDMSVLPLVFPSNISCFSRGSYKVTTTTTLVQRWVSNPSCSQEELARKRELPVPPQPRRTGVLARSDDNLAGENRKVTIINILEGTIWWPYVDIDIFTGISLCLELWLCLCGIEMITVFCTCYNCIFLQSNTREMWDILS